MSEVEGGAVRFTIDHYQPVGAAPALECTYNNLMYACDPCNIRKGNRNPPEAAKQAGYRFFKADNDIFAQHFSNVGIRIEHKSNVGYYTVEALDLNRQNLRRLRDLRRRLFDCHSFMHEGVAGLRQFPIDQLPPVFRGKALSAINSVANATADIENAIDDILRDFARSPMIDPDPEMEARSKDRAHKQLGLEALFPGIWRAPRS